MAPLLKDLALLRAAAAEIEPYLLSNELFWRLTPLKADRAVGNLLSLTPGNLMLSLIKINHYPWSGSEMTEVQTLTRQVEGEIAHWRSAWRKKVEREMAARLKQWQDELVEANQERALIDYPFKVRSRAILDCFGPTDVMITPAQDGLIAMLDERLLRLTVESDFIWEPEVSGGFKVDVYWYLYRSPVKG